MRLFIWLKKELMHLIPVILYFFICFSILISAQKLLLGSTKIHYAGYFGAVVGAIFAGKVILIAENLRFVNSFSDKPLVYSIPWKFFIYALFVVLFQIIEHLIRKLNDTGNWDASYTLLLVELDKSHFWGLQILILVIFFIFIVFTELAQVIGGKKIKKIFFG